METAHITRREFVTFAASGAALGSFGWVRPEPAERTATAAIKAVAFDAFAVFDPRPVSLLADQLFPGAGLSDEWRTRQFEYTWLRMAARHYADFHQVTEDALMFAANKLKLGIDAATRSTLMNAYLELAMWPDVIPVLDAFATAGVRLAFLSNFTRPMLDANIRNAGLAGRFDRVLSTDQRETYKPDPRAYALAVDALHAKREEILFVAYAGWDAAGAKLFGYPTFWVNRQHLPPEELGVAADGSGETLEDCARFLTARLQERWA